MNEGIQLSSEQEAILKHSPAFHARVLAGPGTGKSFTATMWLGELHRDVPGFRSKMLTFTRAATKEFLGKLEEAGLAGVVDEPSTVHSHALSVLLGMSGHGLPEPIRIPDSWEASRLVRPHLSRLLRDAGHTQATPGVVEKLEREMAADWETLTDDTVMLADVDPLLRSAYIGTWQQHRAAFGYSLLAELPYRAGNALEDHGEDQPPKVELLIVDEYQDLNAADIRFIMAHAKLNVSVVAIGDDDQSIYGWRYAEPQGIRDFCSDFATEFDYKLTISRRCGKAILDAANELIASAPGRPRKSPLNVTDDNPTGLFRYLRFRGHRAEAAAAADIAAARVAVGVEPHQILVLVRSKVDRWRAELQTEFERVGLVLASVDWVDDAIADPVLRALIALSRLTVDSTDSLAWWVLTEGLTQGLGAVFTQYIYDGRHGGERWGSALLRLHANDYPDLAAAQSRRAKRTVDAVLARLSEVPDELEAFVDQDGDHPWSEWLLGEAKNGTWLNDVVGEAMGDDAERLVTMVASAVPADIDLGAFLNQLEPLGKDLAAEETGGVRLMTMASSKGLTADTAIVMGVEAGLVPLEPAHDRDQERRLLYVALTRAQRVCVATCANRRTGPLARSGGGQPQTQRSPSPLLDGLSYGRPQNGDQFVESHLDLIRGA